MSQQQAAVDSSIIKSLYPLSLVADHLLDQLIDKATVEYPEPGQTILKRSSSAEGYYHYLIEGDAEHRISFEERIALRCSDAACTNPLQEFLKEGGSIKAGEGCCVLSIAESEVDECLSWSQNQEFVVVHMDEEHNGALDEAIIDDDFQDDWTEMFLKSQLAANIPASTMIEMFSALEDIDVAAGTEIIQENSPGDYFYIIKKGYAEVITNPYGPFKGETFELVVGDYFGDEALVADTTRNATVKMTEDGILGRLSHADFDRIIKDPMMETLSERAVADIAPDKLCLLDVRLAAEFRHGHYEGAKNYPIAYIRKHLDSFENDITYVVVPGCGRRGELAVYLLRQAGYHVFLMAEQS